MSLSEIIYLLISYLSPIVAAECAVFLPFNLQSLQLCQAWSRYLIFIEQMHAYANVFNVCFFFKCKAAANAGGCV